MTMVPNCYLYLFIINCLSINGFAINPVDLQDSDFREVSSELLRDNCIEDQYQYASVKGCRCYLFQSNGESSGVFKSPNHPHPYPPELGCVVYTFVGDINELVEITFQTFDMTSGSKKKCTDYIRLFLNLDRAELNEKDAPDYELCGTIGNLPQTTFYSKNRVLLIELATSGKAGNLYQAFTGTFRFLSKDNYKNDGQLEYDKKCSRSFHSGDDRFGRSKTGRFFSPLYPQNYPGGEHCVYKFKGLPGERVMVTFKNILLEGYQERCNARTAGDVIIVSEGDSTSGARLARICGLANSVQVVSDGPSMAILFQSDRNQIEAKGFKAVYEFISRNKVKATPYLEEDIRGDAVNPNWDKQVPDPPYRKPPNRFEFKSKMKRFGEFQSQDYPKTYPTNLYQNYVFEGQLGEIVQVDFHYFQLDKAKYSISCRNHIGDKMDIFDGSSDQDQLLGSLCGDRSKSFRSSGNFLTLRFVSDSNTYSGEIGFKGSYRFEEKTVNRNSKNAQEDCRYIIQSNGTQLEGFISTPSASGSYASTGGGGALYSNSNSNNNNRICSWQLHGVPGQRIRLSFMREYEPRDSSFNGAFSGAHKIKCPDGSQVDVYNYRLGGSGETIKADVVKYCGKDSTHSIMSASVPRMDIVFANQPNNGIRLKYAFVRNFAVASAYGRHRPPGCRFEFRSVEHPSGNFSSPNYPGLYPYDILCEYKFIGRPDQGVFVQFTDFDVESVSTDCKDSFGDYLEATGCPTTMGPALKRKRLCKAQNRMKPFKVEWYEPCLLLKFHSNDRFIRRGFLGLYDFRDLQSPYIGANNSATRCNSRLSINMLIVVIVTTLLTLNMLPINFTTTLFITSVTFTFNT